MGTSGADDPCSDSSWNDLASQENRPITPRHQIIGDSKLADTESKTRGGRTSRFAGVGASNNRSGTWQARILVHGKVTHLGYYKKEEEAARAYDRVSLALNNLTATNFPQSSYSEDDISHLRSLDRAALQQALGVKPMQKSSRFRGVSRKKNKWEAKVMVQRKWAYRELFNTEEEAARGYDAAVWSLKPPDVALAFVNFKDRGALMSCAKLRTTSTKSETPAERATRGGRVAPILSQPSSNNASSPKRPSDSPQGNAIVVEGGRTVLRTQPVAKLLQRNSQGTSPPHTGSSQGGSGGSAGSNVAGNAALPQIRGQVLPTSSAVLAVAQQGHLFRGLQGGPDSEKLKNTQAWLQRSSCGQMLGSSLGDGGHHEAPAPEILRAVRPSCYSAPLGALKEHTSYQPHSQRPAPDAYGVGLTSWNQRSSLQEGGPQHGAVQHPDSMQYPDSLQHPGSAQHPGGMQHPNDAQLPGGMLFSGGVHQVVISSAPALPCPDSDLMPPTEGYLSDSLIQASGGQSRALWFPTFEETSKMIHDTENLIAQGYFEEQQSGCPRTALCGAPFLPRALSAPHTTYAQPHSPPSGYQHRAVLPASTDDVWQSSSIPSKGAASHQFPLVADHGTDSRSHFAVGGNHPQLGHATGSPQHSALSAMWRHTLSSAQSRLGAAGSRHDMPSHFLASADEGPPAPLPPHLATRGIVSQGNISGMGVMASPRGGSAPPGRHRGNGSNVGVDCVLQPTPSDFERLDQLEGYGWHSGMHVNQAAAGCPMAVVESLPLAGEIKAGLLPSMGWLPDSGVRPTMAAASDGVPSALPHLAQQSTFLNRTDMQQQQRLRADIPERLSPMDCKGVPETADDLGRGYVIHQPMDGRHMRQPTLPHHLMTDMPHFEALPPWNSITNSSYAAAGQSGQDFLGPRMDGSFGNSGAGFMPSAPQYEALHWEEADWLRAAVGSHDHNP